MQVKPQVPAEQEAVALATLVVHLLAQAPQLLTSLVSSTHDPLQFVSVPHPEVQADIEQLGVPASALHTRPQVPQLFLSLVVSTHALPHFVNPLLQMNPHVALWHVGVPFATAGHLLPHALQFRMSDVSSTQAPPQRYWPAGQPDTHWAPPSLPASAAVTEQTGVPASALHEFAQSPQLVDVLSTEQVPLQRV